MNPIDQVGPPLAILTAIVLLAYFGQAFIRAWRDVHRERKVHRFYRGGIR